MKKVMMLVAMAVCASSIQAAQVIWSNDAALMYNLNGTVMTGTDAVNCNLIVQLINVTQGGTVMDTLTGIGMTPGVLSGATSNYIFGTGATTDDVLGVIMYATFGGDDYYMVISDSSWVVAGINNGSIDTFAWASGSTAAGNWIPVPEPTAMALLALGAAAFGLRRRFRK